MLSSDKSSKKDWSISIDGVEANPVGNSAKVDRAIIGIDFPAHFLKNCRLVIMRYYSYDS